MAYEPPSHIYPKTRAERAAQAPGEARARVRCYRDCSAGNHLDFENGVVSICKSADECEGWHSYLHTQSMEG